MDLEDIIAIHLEAIEVILNHILYIRGVYPSQIFKKRRVYNTPVFIASFPALNCYLGNVLKTVKQMLMNQGQELKMEVIIYGDESEHKESYLLEMLPVVAQDPQNQDQYLLEFEQQLRSAIYKLAERVKKLPRLDKSVKFKVHIHTTESHFNRLSHDAQYQEFPWLQTDGNSPSGDARVFSLLPLATVQKVGLKMEAQIFKC